MNNAVISDLSIEKNTLQVTRNNFNAPLNHLLQFGEELLYSKGQVLFHVGNIARGFYIIMSGEVKVSKFGVDGKEQIIKILSKGDFIGHEALLYDQRFHEYAEVLNEASIYYVGRDDFDQVCANDPLVLSYLVHSLCSNLNKVEERLVSSAYEPVRGRLATILMELANTYTRGDQSVIKLSRSDLAKMVGTAKETSIRLLSEFKSENLLDIDGQSIIIKNHDALKRVACMYK